ncbi:MAG: HAD family hydrolase [Clostridia bacterium]|nr:HAD family hydrolase [Clostridia bacterium]
MKKKEIRQNLDELRSKKAFLCDMDGVIYHGSQIIPGVVEFIEWLKRENKKYLFLTNGSGKSPRELSEKLARMGLDITEDHFFTSAQATASFLAGQCPGGTVYAIGEPGLLNALYDAGFSMNSHDPDYVVFGKTTNLNYAEIERAVLLVQRGAALIGTNSDVTDPGENGIVPACRALIAPIEMTTGRRAYFIGKPNPLMMRHALKKLEVSRRDAAIIGDRMDTDIIAGIENEMDTVLVLSGVSTAETVSEFAYRPKFVLENVGKIAD